MRVEQEQRSMDNARRLAEQDAAAQRYAAKVLKVLSSLWYADCSKLLWGSCLCMSHRIGCRFDLCSENNFIPEYVFFKNILAAMMELLCTTCSIQLVHLWFNLSREKSPPFVRVYSTRMKHKTTLPSLKAYNVEHCEATWFLTIHHISIIEAGRTLGMLSVFVPSCPNLKTTWFGHVGCKSSIYLKNIWWLPWSIPELRYCFFTSFEPSLLDRFH